MEMFSRLSRAWPGLLLIVALSLIAFSPAPPANAQQDDPSTYNTRGLELYKAAKYADAVNLYKQAIKLKKDYAEAHMNLGDAYLRLGEFKKAIESYKQAVKYQPALALAFNNLGTAYYKLGDHKKAIGAYQEAIRIEPKLASAYINLGVIYADEDKKQAALDQYRILKSIDPQLAQKLYRFIYKPVASVFSPTGGVRLTVLVTDSSGHPFPNLTAENFQIVDEGVAQTITSFSAEKFPVAYGLALDTSGSMRPAFSQELELARTIIQSNEPSDETLLIRFISSDKIETVQEFTTDTPTLLKELETLYVEGGQSAILDAVYLAAQGVAQYKADDSSYRRRAVILLTDGDERASYYSLDDVVALLRRIDVQVFVVCLSSDEGGSQFNRSLVKTAIPLLSRLATETGGVAFYPKTVTDLNTNIRQLISLLHQQHVITYQPTNGVTAGKFRNIKVSVTNKPGQEKLFEAVRAGYVVAEPQPTP
jgi:Ca-activated chloride channel family protein